MTTNDPIRPEKITKPIQLLGAWLAGLFSIDSCFLLAANNLPKDSWEAGALVIAAIINVPIFLLAVFLLQTRFRPELQEDSYYSSYLSRKTNEPITVNKEDLQFMQIRQKLTEIESRVSGPTQKEMAAESNLVSITIGVNKHLPDRDQIGKRLSELGVVGYSLFGGDMPPPSRIVAISKYLPKDIVRDVINVARELGFHHYTIFDNQEEEAIEEILFGAYGEAQFEIAGNQNPNS